MDKDEKARYVVELDVVLEMFQFHILEKRFEIGRHWLCIRWRTTASFLQIYPRACVYLESLVNQNVVELEEINGTDDRKYKFKR
ncbi:hypothetical protein ACOQFO_06835 [Ureibacillus sp. MALMAid1270]|uniref:hypothetical protein n=1 Tax=Ureibacillus sp. MALMAid1270 TaxID=3411629 RepID=UPI003BA704EE